jgi:hypothetical protein
MYPQNQIFGALLGNELDRVEMGKKTMNGSLRGENNKGGKHSGGKGKWPELQKENVSG